MNLSWDSFPTHLKTMLVGMMTSSDYTDVTLVCGDQVQYKAHKVVLSASSPVMRTILQSNNTDNPLIYLRGVQHEDMEAILQFIYLGEATVKQGRTEEFFKLAKDFEIRTYLGKDQENSGTVIESNIDVNPLEDSQYEHTASIETITNDIDLSINVKEEALSETENEDSLNFDKRVTYYDSDEQHDYNQEFDLDFIEDEVGEVVVKEEKDDVSYSPGEHKAKLKKKRISTDHFDISGIACGKDCKICGHTTQKRMRLLKHYCTVHFKKELITYFKDNTCTICGYKSYIGKVSSQAIHVGLEHKVIQEILTKNSIAYSEPLTSVVRNYKRKVSPSENLEKDFSSEFGPLVPWHDKNSSSEGMKRIQRLGNSCLKCGKEFKFFRSSLLPHYCGHFYSDIAKHIEPFFTDDKCNLCGSHSSQRKSQVIHLGTAHELVLKFIEKLKSDQENGEAQQTINMPPLEEMNKTC